MPINGKTYAWEDVTLSLPTGPALGLIEIEDNVERDIEHVYAQGAAPRAMGRGNVKLDGKLKMLPEQWQLLLTYAASMGKSVFTMPAFAMTAAFINDDLGISTIQYLRCSLAGRSRKAAQGDKSLAVEVPFKCLDIEENGVSLVAGLNLP